MCCRFDDKFSLFAVLTSLCGDVGSDQLVTRYEMVCIDLDPSGHITAFLDAPTAAPTFCHMLGC